MDNYVHIDGKVMRGFKVGDMSVIDTDIIVGDTIESEVSCTLLVTTPQCTTESDYGVGECSRASDDEPGIPIGVFWVNKEKKEAYAHWVSISEVDGKAVIYDSIAVNSYGDVEQTYILPNWELGDNDSLDQYQLVGAIGSNDITLYDSELGEVEVTSK